MADIGKRIASRRKELEMTQEELASKLGYKNKSTIAKIEIGVNDIPQSKVKAFANALNTTVAYLMGWDDDNEPEYYLNDETAQAAQEIFQNKELRALFDVQRDMDSDDLKALHNMALALKRKERGNTDDTGD